MTLWISRVWILMAWYTVAALQCVQSRLNRKGMQEE